MTVAIFDNSSGRLRPTAELKEAMTAEEWTRFEPVAEIADEVKRLEQELRDLEAAAKRLQDEAAAAHQRFDRDRPSPVEAARAVIATQRKFGG